jgi:hypothetical protein
LDSTNPKVKYIGGSNFDAWSNTIAGQAAGSIWHGPNPDAERVHERQVASLSLLAGISPKDEFEGMLAAQLLASHNAAMECYRRAMVAEQSLEGGQRGSDPSEQAVPNARDLSPRISSKNG